MKVAFRCPNGAMKITSFYNLVMKVAYVHNHAVIIVLCPELCNEIGPDAQSKENFAYAHNRFNKNKYDLNRATKTVSI